MRQDKRYDQKRMITKKYHTLSSIHQITTKIIQYLQSSQTTKKNIIFFILFTKLQILTNILMPISKVGETQILEIINQKSRNHKGRRPITNGSMKTHQHVYHKRNAIPWLLTINFEPKLHKRSEDHGSLPRQIEPKFHKTGFSLPRRQIDIAHRQSKSQNDHHRSIKSVNYTKLVNIRVQLHVP